MNFLSNIKVKTKLLLSYVIVAILIIVVGVIGIVSLKTVATNSNEMYSNRLQTVYMMSDMEQMLTQIKSDMLELVYKKDTAKKADIEKDIQDNVDGVETYKVAYEKLSMNNTEKQIYPIFKTQLEQYISLSGNITSLVNAGNFNEANNQYQQIVTVIGAMTPNLDKLVSTNIETAKTSNDDNNSIYMNSNIIMIILIIVGLITAIGLGLILSNNINVPLIKMVNLLESLAGFDLTHSYPVTRKDEFGKAGAALAKAQENIKGLVKVIMENPQDMSASSEELSATAEELSSKTEEMDSAIKDITSGIQETSAASEQITASVEEVDSNINKLFGKVTEGSTNSVKSKEIATIAQRKGKETMIEVRALYADKKSSMLKAIKFRIHLKIYLKMVVMY